MPNENTTNAQGDNGRANELALLRNQRNQAAAQLLDFQLEYNLVQDQLARAQTNLDQAHAKIADLEQKLNPAKA